MRVYDNSDLDIARVEGTLIAIEDELKNIELDKKAVEDEIAIATSQSTGKHATDTSKVAKVMLELWLDRLNQREQHLKEEVVKNLKDQVSKHKNEE